MDASVDKLMANQYVRECENRYKQFMNLSSFPTYQLIFKDLSLEKADNEGFDSFASVAYDVTTQAHQMIVWSKLHSLQAEYVLFHEFTHILDEATYVGNDKVKYVCNHGYTEYHASQIELMRLVGAQSAATPVTFSMNSEIETISGKMTVERFMLAPHKHASEMIARSDFPASIEALKITLGRIFNYYGRRSICKMYATDFVDTADNENIAKLIYDQTVGTLNNFMVGWFDSTKVGWIDSLYGRMIVSLAQKNNL